MGRGVPRRRSGPRANRVHLRQQGRRSGPDPLQQGPIPDLHRLHRDSLAPLVLRLLGGLHSLRRLRRGIFLAGGANGRVLRRRGHPGISRRRPTRRLRQGEGVGTQGYALFVHADPGSPNVGLRLLPVEWGAIPARDRRPVLRLQPVLQRPAADGPRPRGGPDGTRLPWRDVRHDEPGRRDRSRPLSSHKRRLARRDRRLERGGDARRGHSPRRLRGAAVRQGNGAAPAEESSGIEATS